MEDLLKSVIRTFVPVVVGLIISGLATANIEVDAEALFGLVDAIFVGLYYTAIRFLESKNESFGWLLGLPSQPSYVKETQGDAPRS